MWLEILFQINSLIIYSGKLTVVNITLQCLFSFYQLFLEAVWVFDPWPISLNENKNKSNK